MTKTKPRKTMFPRRALLHLLLATALDVWWASTLEEMYERERACTASVPATEQNPVPFGVSGDAA